MEKIYWIIQSSMIIVPIVAFISTIIDSRKKEYTEISYRITSKDNKDDDWFRY
jgi:hypothetical protein